MAESTLSIDLDALLLEVAVFLGYSATPGDWSAEEAAKLDRHVQSGVRQFYYPPQVQGVPTGYEWSFLKPTTTIATIAPYTTGTVGVSSGTCTLTGGTWPSWAATDGTLVIDGTTYTISSRDSDTELTVVGSDVTAGETDWTLKHSGLIDLPDDCGRVVGDFFYAATVGRKSIVLVSEQHYNALLSRSTDAGAPQVACVRHKAQVAPAAQRLEVAFYPVPDAAYTLTYTYEAYSGKLVDTTNPYPLGGMRYAELLTESCLAIAEQRDNDERGIHTERFEALLRTGIARDRKQGARYYGSMSPDSNVVIPHRGETGINHQITYKGDTW